MVVKERVISKSALVKKVEEEIFTIVIHVSSFDKLVGAAERIHPEAQGQTGVGRLNQKRLTKPNPFQRRCNQLIQSFTNP